MHGFHCLGPSSATASASSDSELPGTFPQCRVARSTRHRTLTSASRAPPAETSELFALRFARIVAKQGACFDWPGGAGAIPTPGARACDRTKTLCPIQQQQQVVWELRVWA